MKTLGYTMLAGLMAMANVANAQDMSGKETLQKAADYAAGLMKFTADIELLFDAEVDAETENFVTDYTVALLRPGTAMVHMNNRYMELWLYTSDTETTRYLPELKQYIVESTPTPPAPLVRSASNNVIMPAMVILSELTLTNPLIDVLSGELPITLVGTETVNDIECDRVRFQYADFGCDVWIGKGEEALIHRIQPDTSGIVYALSQQGHEVVRFDVKLDVLHWQPNVVEESLLTYTPQEGVEKVAQFNRPQPVSAAEGLVGQPAPEVELKTLTGEDFSLASKKDNEVVILDFWATWCGPCRMGMPILSKVAKEFEGKGVRLYAVNLQEGPDEINPFLESTGLDLNVLLDTDGAVGNAFLAESIPQMVIVGKDGTIKKVHIGVTPNYEDEVRAELTELTE